ncbi:MAG: LysR family transcriptional regulator [Sporomusaceae bacterium]|nr:LysR family transcriptional regulator [Sporomusaceae bacterium]
MMELRQLEIFRCAAKTLNFTAAGVKLGYAQSNITGQIRRLESELQVKLFERLGRGIRLTSEGKQFLQRAEAILELCEKARMEISPQHCRGAINIGTAETICVYRLPQILLEYRKRYPLVEIKIHTEACDNLYSMLKANTIDLALVLTGSIRQPELTARLLHEETMAAVVSPLHPLACRPAITAADFAGECLIITLPGCGYRPLILSMLERRHSTPGSLMELSSAGAIKQCAICGLGIAILPLVAVQAEISQGKLIRLKLAEDPVEVKAQLVYHRQKWLTPAMQSFIDLCQQQTQALLAEP